MKSSFSLIPICAFIFLSYRGLAIDIKQFEDDKRIVVRDAETKIISQDYKTQADKLRISLSANGVLSSYVTQSQIIEGKLSFKSTQNIWTNIQVISTNSNFTQITTNHGVSGTTNSFAEEKFQRTTKDKISIITFGAGPSYRFNFINDFFNSRNFFEEMGANLTYSQASDKLRGLTYIGLGTNASYLLSKRITENWAIGGRLSYNWALVTRKSESDTDVTRERSLFLSYPTIGIEVSTYLR